MGDYGLQIHHTPLKEGEIREDGGGQFAPTEGVNLYRRRVGGNLKVGWS